jgi:hypothetical protein
MQDVSGPKRKVSAAYQANWPRNSRSAGRAQGMLIGTAAAAGAYKAREESKKTAASNKEMQSYEKGKNDGRMFDSSGRPTSNASKTTKALMKKPVK